MEQLNSLFKEKSLKVTPQRYAIYKYLKSTKSHPSAETIYEDLKVNYPTMSLATVYKTLRTLIEIGLVKEINVGEDNFRYDANVDTHPHLICRSCSRVDDIENYNFTFINEEAQKLTDYIIEDSKLFFYGICPECQKEGR
ncbi:Fur family transcriptional regulator [Fonticella tunisiensis]|uniref:Fur family peroxide stress response transcriptional regulator n=1 Tax=Fonticella tunisiensis TaxID=1096341 RepID=A0A4V3ETD2_9CLOT|nr:Fur family transcriptional regulator [Fonticella tunisiensis]TDT61147.1 Fur family peroxide stress response transcriptional regulator [Fonticella tunisiensis]